MYCQDKPNKNEEKFYALVVNGLEEKTIYRSPNCKGNCNLKSGSCYECHEYNLRHQKVRIIELPL